MISEEAGEEGEVFTSMQIHLAQPCRCVFAPIVECGLMGRAAVIPQDTPRHPATTWTHMCKALKN